MHQRNELTNVVQQINFDADIKTDLVNQLKEIKRMHSFIIYAIFKNDVLTGWEINYNISMINKYNTINRIDAAKYILKYIEKSKEVKPSQVVGYMQPVPELLIKQYTPLINKLVKNQKDKWQWLEFDDLSQMCKLCICDLYYKGYYVHKSIIQRTFNNYVLMHIRKDKNKPEIISLEQTYRKGESDENVTIADMLPDVKQENDREDEENHIVEEQILREVKDIIVDYVGLRQYDQLLREYGNKSTTAWSRKLMQKIKAHLFEMGITRKSFNVYYN